MTPPLASVVDSTLAQRRDTRRAEALGLAMAGLSREQIADRLSLDVIAVNGMLDRPLANTGTVEHQRELENLRLDRAQAAIWPDVLQGNVGAIQSFLAISNRRAKMNGLDAPVKLALTVSVKQEMEQALQQLEQIVLGEVIDADPDSHSG